MKDELDDQLEADARRLAQVLRELPERSGEAELLQRGRARLMLAGRPTPPAHRQRWLIVAGLAAAAAVALVASRYWVPATNEAGPVTWQIEGSTTTARGGRWVDAASAAVAVRFSDGTRARLAPGGRLHVLSSTPQGAQLLLERGSVDLDVQHRPDTSWSLAAGPFTVKVTGTRFGVTWQDDTEELDVRVARGSVRVQSDDSTINVPLPAGQNLHASGRARAYEVRSEQSEEREARQAIASSSAVPAPPTQPEPSANLPLHTGTAQPPAPLDWGQALSRRDYRGILESAERAGLDDTLTTRDARDLWALEQAASALGRAELSERTLLTLRQRFPRSSARAAFELARLEERRGHGRQALQWYERYLREAPSGPYAAQAEAARTRLVER